MKLELIEGTIEDIMLDPYNPRFINLNIFSQSELQKYIMDRGDTKELLNSMKSGIRWINRIVVRETSTINTNQRKNIPYSDDYKYIAAEGNSRMACLKHMSMLGIIDMNETIPLLLAVKEFNESQEKYEREIRLIQGIANVMVVKQWEPIAKAHHLYNLYNDKIINPRNSDIDKIFKDIANELGIKISEVRSNVIGYKFYAEIAKESDTIKEGDWKWLETIYSSPIIRNLFGMKKNSVDFEWDFEEEFDMEKDEEITYKKELLNAFPEIIKSADNAGFKCKEFRNLFKEIISIYSDKSIEDIYECISDVINPDSTMNWKKLKSITEMKCCEEAEEKIKLKGLNEILVELNNFPSPSDWAYKSKDTLEKILSIVQKHLSIIG